VRRGLRLAAALCGTAFIACAAAQDKPADFAWRATLEAPAGASLARVRLPAEALVRLQSAQAADLRMFDADGRAVPFAQAPAPPAAQAPRARTPAFPALPLYSAQAGARVPKGSVQIRVQDGAQGSAWVQLAPATPAGDDAGRLPSAVFDTRASRATISGIAVDAKLRANAPARLALFASTDLAQWTPLPLRGRLYRFDGAGAPANDTLELEAPFKLENHYLRLDWDGQDGVVPVSVTGLVAAAGARPERLAAPLPEPRRDGAQALEWELRFATPPAAIALSTAQANVLLPVRVLGRNQPSQPWRTLGQTVVWRLGNEAAPGANEPLALPPTPVRWLRVEATHGMRLDAVPLTASLLFDPLDLVFVAGGRGPYTLAAGRPRTEPAALPLSMVAAASTRAVEALPTARIVASHAQPQAPRPAWLAWLPAWLDGTTAVLWGVLLAGVLLLGGAAWGLLRQLKPADGNG
jgi:hypothetical protein